MSLQTQPAWSTPGSVYGVDLRITNKGAPYADSFVITEHYRYRAGAILVSCDQMRGGQG